MDEKIKKIKEDIEKFLMDSMEHQNKHIDYILYDPDTNDSYVLASDGNEDAIEFTPFSKNDNGGYNSVPEWDYNFDYYIYNYLEEGKKIGFMTADVHQSIWNSIHELYPEDIDYKDGVQNYLQYCADNGITKEYLDNKTGFNTPDVMKYFEGLSKNEIMKYKGFVIEVDDSNVDNPTESLVHIYDNNQNYIDGTENETVSLRTIRLRQNIIKYIEDTYITNKNMESEKAYFTFVLGYDILNDMLSKSSTPENDLCYDFCNMISSQFLESKEYRNERYSAYEMLEQWVNNNKEYIKQEYQKFIGENDTPNITKMIDNEMYARNTETEDKIYNSNMKIIKQGYRNKEPIALVEKNTGNDKEYIIAFYFKAKENELSWAYAYYYNEDKSKAEIDFKKVIDGGNLADTFEKKNKDKER